MSIQIVVAPDEIKNKINQPKLFLAEGITNCTDWQKEVISSIGNSEIENLTILNPRREVFDVLDNNISGEQIKWEFEHLKNADIISFWFSGGSLNPIVLYELGMWGNSRNIPIIIGVDPEYERKEDIIIQTKLARSDLNIAFSFQEFCDNVIRECIYFSESAKI